MPYPTRLVCAYCLASSEASDGDDPRSPAHCPSCASPLERPDHRTGSTDETDETGEASPRRETWPSPDSPTPRPTDKPTGGRIGRFAIGARLGGGGYGDVYQARDPRLDREVALKVLKATKLDAKAIERFLREARAAARLEHPFIVGLHDAGQDDGRLWIAYQLVRGRTLSQLRDARSLDVRATVSIVRDLAEALDHAHRRGISHRDLKPANVIIDDEGRPHLTDFGLARRLDQESELTGEGTVLGTPAYMSPEQAAGRAHDADGRSDVYSLGVILYELLCGRRPTDVASDTPFWKVDLKTPPPTPQAVDRTVPRELDRVCMKALALNPADRFADARLMAEALDQWLHRGPVAASKPKRGFALAVGALTVALVVGWSMMSHEDVGTRFVGSAEDVTRHMVLKPTAIAEGVESIDQEKAPYVGSSVRQVVHKRGCPHARSITLKHIRWYWSLEEAEADGHNELCLDCRPPTLTLPLKGGGDGKASPP